MCQPGRDAPDQDTEQKRKERRERRRQSAAKGKDESKDTVQARRLSFSSLATVPGPAERSLFGLRQRASSFAILNARLSSPGMVIEEYARHRIVHCIPPVVYDLYQYRVIYRETLIYRRGQTLTWARP